MPDEQSQPTERLTLPTRVPPGWVNRVVAGVLHTPGLERVLGRFLVVLSVTGRRSGRRYSMPLRYMRDGDAVVVITKRMRRWWRNLPERPIVDLRLLGRTIRTRAEIVEDAAEKRRLLVAFLEQSSRDAKPYGIELDEAGRVRDDDAAALLPLVVLIRLPLSRAERPAESPPG